MYLQFEKMKANETITVSYSITNAFRCIEYKIDTYYFHIQSLVSRTLRNQLSSWCSQNFKIYSIFFT